MRNTPNVYVVLILILGMLLSMLTIYAYSYEGKASFAVSARSAALYQPETNTFLYSKNAEERMPMASTTKIMTALVALENSDLSDEVKIDDSAIGIEGSSAYLRQGDVLTMEELLYALLLQSANDAAVAIACYVGDGIDGFSDMMNARAEELGLENTHFTNPHGLDDEQHYTTACDLAIITAEAMRCEVFQKITSTYKKSFHTEERSRTYVNHNKLLNMYDGCTGVKTGFTKRSGRCLVGAAERDGLDFITVTLDAPSDWRDHTAMLDFGFEMLEKITFASENDYIYEIPIIDGEKDRLIVKNTQGVSLITNKGEHTKCEYIKLVRFAVAPITEGDILGEIIYTLDGKETARISLVATENINKKKTLSIIDRILSIFN